MKKLPTLLAAFAALTFAAFTLAACGDDSKRQEIRVLEAEKASLETAVEKAKAAVEKLEQTESDKAAELKRLDMQP